MLPAFPKQVPVRLKGNAMRKFRFEIWMRDGKSCVKCGQEVSFNGKRADIPPMHLAHKRNKRMHGDTPENCITACPTCHLVGMHNPKPCPPKGIANADRREA